MREGAAGLLFLPGEAGDSDDKPPPKCVFVWGATFPEFESFFNIDALQASRLDGRGYGEFGAIESVLRSGERGFGAGRLKLRRRRNRASAVLQRAATTRQTFKTVGVFLRGETSSEGSVITLERGYISNVDLFPQASGSNDLAMEEIVIEFDKFQKSL